MTMTYNTLPPCDGEHDKFSFCDECRYFGDTDLATGNPIEEFQESIRTMAKEFESTGSWNLGLLKRVSTEPTGLDKWEEFKAELKKELEVAAISLSKVYDDHGHYDDARCCEECLYWDKEMER